MLQMCTDETSILKIRAKNVKSCNCDKVHDSEVLDGPVRLKEVEVAKVRRSIGSCMRRQSKELRRKVTIVFQI